MAVYVRHLAVSILLISALSIHLEGFMSRYQACNTICGNELASSSPAIVPWAAFEDEEPMGRAGNDDGDIIPPPPVPGGTGVEQVRPVGVAVRPVGVAVRPVGVAVRPVGVAVRPVAPGPVAVRPIAPGPVAVRPIAPEPVAVRPVAPGPQPVYPGPNPYPGPGPIDDRGPTGSDDKWNINGELNFKWDTQIGWNTTFYGNISGGREHESLINLDNGGYIKDKDWFYYGAGFESNPWIVTNIGVRGGIKFGNVGGRRRRRRRRSVSRRS
ncbi:unnamed protein product [Orchesella dallaii]|uniref:Uncharacterized protein n=1 Tax=Orchesella dallaii TaxID=48710 RepID=A0ABP1RMV7_9HEXA